MKETEIAAFAIASDQSNGNDRYASPRKPSEASPAELESAMTAALIGQASAATAVVILSMLER